MKLEINFYWFKGFGLGFSFDKTGIDFVLTVLILNTKTKNYDESN